MKKLIQMFLVAVTFFSCSPSTEITKSWMEPGSSFTPSNDVKTFVIAMVKDESTRRIIEDALVNRMKTTAMASYHILTPEMIKSGGDEVLNQTVALHKFTHILLMRLADVEKETSYVPGSTSVVYSSYNRYYGYGANYYSSPGYYTTDKKFIIETTIFLVNPNKMLWTGTSKTVNPSHVDQAVKEIGDAVVKKMKTDGFLK
jgi:hypothetical protein